LKRVSAMPYHALARIVDDDGYDDDQAITVFQAEH